MKKDLKDNIGLVLLKEPVDAVHTTVASALLDTANCFGIEVDAIVGALTGVDGSNYVTPVLQESDTTAAADFTAVASTDIIGAFSAVNSTTVDSVIQRAGYIGHKRYVRVNFVYTGTGITAGIVGAVGIVGYAKKAPVSAPAPVSAT